MFIYLYFLRLFSTHTNAASLNGERSPRNRLRFEGSLFCEFAEFEKLQFGRIAQYYDEPTSIEGNAAMTVCPALNRGLF